MSDFDKEAEREKLREKYEQDQDDRAVAEKMSELLLQGATMTNAHCSECGDPIFRYEGQEFCATCEKAVDRGEPAEDDSESDDGNIEVTTPDENARVKFGAGTADAADAGEQPAQQPTQQPAETPPQDDSQAQQPTQPHQPAESSAQSHGQPQHPQQTPGEEVQPPRQSGQHEQAREVPSVDSGAGADGSTARDSLVRTLTRFSQQAEATDDPRRAQEYLAAAREAAEALSALRR